MNGWSKNATINHTPDPAAGVDIPDITVDKGFLWKLDALKFRAVNAAVAASRYAVVRILAAGVNITHEFGPPAASIISETHTYSLSSIYTQRNETTGVVSTNNASIRDLVLDDRAIIRVVYVNKNAGDNLEPCWYRFYWQYRPQWWKE